MNWRGRPLTSHEVITVQAAREVPSHFNTRTSLDSMLFNIMGASILLVWAATGVLALVLGASAAG